MSSSWVAIDFETANEHRGSPCAVGMTKVVEGRIADSWGTLIQPPSSLGNFNPFNVAVHGITSADVTTAPVWAAALADVVAFADGLPLVAHNAGFDMGVIRAACDAESMAWPELRYTCSQVVARRTWKLVRSLSCWARCRLRAWTVSESSAMVRAPASVLGSSSYTSQPSTTSCFATVMRPASRLVSVHFWPHASPRRSPRNAIRWNRAYKRSSATW